MKIHMKYVMALITALFATTATSTAATIAIKHGLPTDIWLSWPNDEGLDNPALLDVFPEYRREYTGSEFKAAKAAGFDFIRLTIDPAVFIYNRNAQKTEKLLSGMKVAIAEIQAAGLKVDVDLHSMSRPGSDPGTFQIMASPELFRTYLEVVRDVGRSIADMPPDQIVFEPMNEPTIDCDLDEQSGQVPKWPDMLKELHYAARSAAPMLTLILSGACWGGADGLATLDPHSIQDQNIIWSFHNYEPFVFTHQGEIWTDGHEKYIAGLRFPPDLKQKQAIMAASRKAIRKADLPENTRKTLVEYSANDLEAYFEPGWAEDRARQPFYKVEAWAKQNNIPASRILLGEFGANREEIFTKEREIERAGFYKLMSSEATKRGYAWSTWSWSGGMGLTISDKSRQFDPVMLQGLGLLD